MQERLRRTQTKSSHGGHGNQKVHFGLCQLPAVGQNAPAHGAIALEASQFENGENGLCCHPQTTSPRGLLCGATLSRNPDCANSSAREFRGASSRVERIAAGTR